MNNSSRDALRQDAPKEVMQENRSYRCVDHAALGKVIAPLLPKETSSRRLIQKNPARKRAAGNG